MTLPQSCATCGKSLEDRQPPTCPRCKTLYCGSDCQRADWKAGHKKICKAIAEEGGAAQRHANVKAAEAVAALLKERAAPAKTACRLCKTAPPRYRAGVASIAWRTTRRFSTKTP